MILCIYDCLTSLNSIVFFIFRVQFFVRTQDRNVFVDEPFNITLRNLKRRVGSKSGMRISHQLVVFVIFYNVCLFAGLNITDMHFGKYGADWLTLREYDIQHNSTLHAIECRIVGGITPPAQIEEECKDTTPPAATEPAVAEPISAIATASASNLKRKNIERSFTLQQFDFRTSLTHLHRVCGWFELNTAPEDVFIDHVVLQIDSKVCFH